MYTKTSRTGNIQERLSVLAAPRDEEDASFLKQRVSNAGVILIPRQLRKSVLHGNCMNIQTASAPRTSNIHSRCGKAFAKNVNSLRSDRTVFAHSTSFVHEEVLRLVQIV